jgi:hypothetical protein
VRGKLKFSRVMGKVKLIDVFENCSGNDEFGISGMSMGFRLDDDVLGLLHIGSCCFSSKLSCELRLNILEVFVLLSLV